MAKINIRQKGSRGELEMCRYFNDLFELPEEDKIFRNLEQTRFNSWTSAGEGYDLKVPVPRTTVTLYVEVKRCEVVSKAAFWKQVTLATPGYLDSDSDSDSNKFIIPNKPILNIPVVTYRKKRQPHRFLLPAAMLKGYEFNPTQFIEFEEPVFRQFITHLI